MKTRSPTDKPDGRTSFCPTQTRRPALQTGKSVAIGRNRAWARGCTALRPAPRRHWHKVPAAASALCCPKIEQTGILSLQAQLFSDRPSPNSNHRLAAPAGIVEHPPRQYLLGRQPAPAVSATQLEGKLTRQSLQGTHAVVIKHIKPAKISCHFTRQGARKVGRSRTASGRSLSRRHIQQSHAGHSSPQPRMAQQPAESACSIAQQHQPAEPQQSITGIADSYAPRIVSHQQNRPAPVGIIPRLIKR